MYNCTYIETEYGEYLSFYNSLLISNELSRNDLIIWFCWIKFTSPYNIYLYKIMKHLLYLQCYFAKYLNILYVLFDIIFTNI